MWTTKGRYDYVSNDRGLIKQGRGGVREGSGRKPFKDPAAVRSERVLFMITKAELAKLKKAAGDVPLSTFVRKIVVRSLERRK